MGSRAHLLAGLRTGGPRSSSPFDGDGDQSQSSIYSDNGSSPPANTGSGMLKANAAPFTPGSRSSQPASNKQTNNVDGQAAAIRMQQAIAAVSSQRQMSPSEGLSDFAAMYGAAQGQPQQQQQQQEMAQLIRQKQAQMLQNQMLAQQQQQQMEMYRLQAAGQQQQHLQQVAAQQRLLLAQMQAEYNQQQQDQAYTAQDQRMVAQASLQASLRQRQAEQMYAQMNNNLQAQQAEDAQAQQQQLLQRLQFLQLQAAAAVQMQTMQEQDDMSLMPSQQSRRNTPLSRSDSPNNAAKEQMRRDRQASQTAADNAKSWRSTSVSLSKEGRSASSRGTTPSIVVDESGSEKSEGASDIETPDTSEEDVDASSSGASTAGKSTHRLSGLGTERRVPSTLSTTVSPRPISLSLAPRSRAFTSEAKMTVPASGSNTGGNGTVSGASRQPRGPPTEFHSINFSSRLSARTRREAMSKLCASPRAASFTITPRSALIA